MFIFQISKAIIKLAKIESASTLLLLSPESLSPEEGGISLHSPSKYSQPSSSPHKSSHIPNTEQSPS